MGANTCNGSANMQASRAMQEPATFAADTATRMPRAASVAVLVAAAALVVLAAVIGERLSDPALVWRTGVIALAGGALLSVLLARHLRTPRFGIANAVTLVRAVCTLLLLALLPAEPSEVLAWLVVAVATFAVALDGVDGALARARGESSAFGARFDMETDALLILVLAALVWQFDKAGAWVLLAGLLRYGFVAASYGLPWLGAALPASRRRQAVCVVQVVSLIAALLPLLPQLASEVIAALGLVLLVWSFGVDVAWLARHARA
jgi:phosphatidylglycerophosphate synthase